MNTSLWILVIAIALLTGVAIAWLWVKNAFSARVAALQTELKASELALSVIKPERDEAVRKYQALQSELGTLQQKEAGLVRETVLLKSSIEEYRNFMQLKEKELAEKQALLIKALQEKTAADVVNQEARNTIDDLKRKESMLAITVENLRDQLSSIKEENAGLEASQSATAKRLEEQKSFLEEAQQNLKNAFGALSADALNNNNASFVELAKSRLEEKVTEARGVFEKKEQAIGELVKPLSESLKNMDTKIQELEGRRIKAYSDIWNYLDQVKATTEGLKRETTNLVGALKTSHSRGRYGELALRRLVEHAGMFEHCDFEEQVSVEDESGRLRPDMIIRLPGNKTLVVDSKAPLLAYMKMFETDDVQEQKMLLAQHVQAVKEHLRKLSAKAYWSQFQDAPDFVIMYMHIESSYGAALQAWPEMMEETMKNRVIIATPTVLLSILSSIGYSWNQLKTMENIELIRDAAVELHDRSAVLTEHLVNVGKNLNNTVLHYNKAVGSMESNFLPQARKINALSQAYVKKRIPEMAPVETSLRSINGVALLAEDVNISNSEEGTAT